MNINDFDNKFINQLDNESLIEFIIIVLDLKNKYEAGQDISTLVQKNREFFCKILEYLILHMDDSEVNQELLLFLENILFPEKKKENDKVEEKEETLSKEDKELRFRLAMYEIYKITNPNRLAGETSLENFINNVKLRGVDVARQYDGKEYEAKISKNTLESIKTNNQSYKENIINTDTKDKEIGR